MKIMLIGPSAAGKTTLIQRLRDREIKYDKTQAIEYIGNYIDTPGEYMQQRGYWGSLTITSHDADIIGLVQDSSSEDCWFSGGLTSKFEKPVIGILTKIDREEGKEIAEMIYERHRLLTKCLEVLGVSPDIAEEDACKIEHVISKESFDAIKKHISEHIPS